MKESDFQREFGKRNTIVGCFELKFTSKTSIPFKALAEHQEQALIDCHTDKGCYFKITDQPIFTGKQTRFHTKKPFDCFFLKRQQAYVVLMFWKPRKQKNVYYIRIFDWIGMRKHANRKSVNEKMAIENAIFKENYMKRREQCI